MSEVMDIIFFTFLYPFQGYCLQYFYGSFLESRIKDRVWNGLAVAASYTVMRLGITWIGPSENWDYRTAVCKLVLALGMASVLAVCFYKAFHLLTVFLVVSFQAVSDITRYTTVILVGELGDGLLDLWNWCIGKEIFRTDKIFLIAVNSGLILQWVLECLVMALFLYFPLKKMVRDFREKEYCMNKTELLFILTPAAVGLMICMLLRIIIITMEDGIPKILYDRYPILIIVLPAILVLSLLSILQGVKLFQDMICRNREKSSRIVLEKQVESLQEHMDEMERIYSGIRGVRHDMKNTLTVIQRLFAGGEAEENGELQAYLSELNQTLEKLEVRFKTGNTVVDTLLNMKYHEALREVPELQMDADQLLFPQELGIRSYDIGVILGNALDNAIDACRKLKEKGQGEEAFIRLSSLQKGNLLILKVENSFDGRLSRKRQDEFPATDKADKDGHGIGLSNIRNTAEKYHGAMDFKIEGKIFILSVMMKDERGNKEGVWNGR